MVGVILGVGDEEGVEITDGREEDNEAKVGSESVDPI